MSLRSYTHPGLMLIFFEQNDFWAHFNKKLLFLVEKKMNFAWFVTKQIDYLVDFYSKSNLLSMSIFTIIVIDVVATFWWWWWCDDVFYLSSTEHNFSQASACCLSQHMSSTFSLPPREHLWLGVGQERLGPSYFLISLVLVPLNSLVWYVPSSRYIRSSAPILFLQEQIKDIIIILQ